MAAESGRRAGSRLVGSVGSAGYLKSRKKPWNAYVQAVQNGLCFEAHSTAIWRMDIESGVEERRSERDSWVLVTKWETCVWVDCAQQSSPRMSVCYAVIDV